MKDELAKEIIECLPDDRTLFHYHKDRYATWLLSEIASQGIDIAGIKQTQFGKLLSRPLVQSIIASKGNGRLCANDFSYVWQEPSKTFMLTLDTWKGVDRHYDQTTRPGVNLVLQLNFSNQHNGYFHEQFNSVLQNDLRSFGHPTLRPGKRKFKHETLAWTRIDLDLLSGEALIEEIQNDWLRYAKSWERCMNCQRNCRWCVVRAFKKTEREKERLHHYLKNILLPYEKIWSEAMLTAALWFLHTELGIHSIYYHTHDSGAKLKSIKGNKPPRSLYTQLPARFCFTPTEQHPEFLLNDRFYRWQLRRKKGLNIQWQQLNLEKCHAA